MKKKYRAASSMEEKAKMLRARFNSERKSAEQEKTRLSRQLVKAIEEFHVLGITRNFVKVLESQLHIVEHYLQGEIGPSATELGKIKKELEDKIRVVSETLQRK